MSATYYCDSCKREMQYNEHERVFREYGRLRVEVVVALDGTWNRGNVCHACIIDAVINGARVAQ